MLLFHKVLDFCLILCYYLRVVREERKIMKDYKIIFVIQGKRNWYVAKLGSEPAAYAHEDLNTLEGLVRKDGHTFYHSWVN